MKKTSPSSNTYVHLSADATWICFSSTSSFSLHSSDVGLSNIIIEESSLGGMRHIRPLHHSPLVLLVASGDKPGTSPRKLKIWNLQILLDSELHVLDLQSMSIRTVLGTCPKANTFSLSATITSLHPTTTTTSSSNQSITSYMTSIHSLSGFATASNVQASNHVSEHLLVYPTADVVGCVDIFDLQDHKLINKIQAHRSQLQLIAMNAHNNLLATCSKTGTIVRIFAVPAGDILFSYRISHLSIHITQLVFCPHSDYLLVTTSLSQVSLCPLFTLKSRQPSAAQPGEPSSAVKMLQSLAQQISTTANNLSQKSQDKEDVVTVDISHLSVGEEDEDGFCAIEKTADVPPDDVEDNHDPADGRGYDAQHNDDDDDDDNISVLTTPTVAAPQLTSSTHSTGEIAPPSNVFNNFWSNLANSQTIFDASLNSIQKIRSYSQDIFSNGKSNQASVHFEIDKDIRRPVMQAAVLASHELQDGNHAVFALVYRPKKLTYYHAPGEDDDNDDLQSAFGDAPHAVQMHTNEEELKLVMVTKQGLYRRLDLSSFQFGYNGPGGHSRGAQSPHVYYQHPLSTPSNMLEHKDVIALVEDERSLLDP